MSGDPQTHLDDGGSAVRVQAGGGLVAEQQGWVRQTGGREGETLPLTPRQYRLAKMRDSLRIEELTINHSA